MKQRKINWVSEKAAFKLWWLQQEDNPNLTDIFEWIKKWYKRKSKNK